MTVPGPVLCAIRDPRLRRYSADRVFAELWATLDAIEPRVAKIRVTARLLRIERRDVRRALDLLTGDGWLEFTHRDTNGRRYYRKVDRREDNRGAARPPSVA